MPPWLDKLLEASQKIWYISRYLDEHGEPVLKIWEIAGGTYFLACYSDGTQFLVNQPGTQIWAIWPSSATLDDTATYLLGPILGFVMRLRGIVSLHASAVPVGDQAFVMIGHPGAGKSTMAAAFAMQGYPVLSEDIVPLFENGKTFLVQAGYPYICLWPDSVNLLFGSPEALPRIIPSWDKRCLDLTKNGYRFHQEPLPLAAIYILDRDRTDQSGPFAESLHASADLMALVANTYANNCLDKSMRAHEFEFLGRLVSSVPLRYVDPDEGETSPLKLCKAILDNFYSLSTSAVIMANSGQNGYI